MFDEEKKDVVDGVGTSQPEVDADNFTDVLKETTSKIRNEYESQIAHLKQENLKLSKDVANSFMNASFASKPSNPAEGLPSLKEAEDAWRSVPAYATNLDKTTAFLNYRHIAMANGHEDPLLVITNNDGDVPLSELREEAAKCANVLAQCVEEAHGDPDTFRAAMARRTTGTVLPTPQNKPNKRR